MCGDDVLVLHEHLRVLLMKSRSISESLDLSLDDYDRALTVWSFQNQAVRAIKANRLYQS